MTCESQSQGADVNVMNMGLARPSVTAPMITSGMFLLNLGQNVHNFCGTNDVRQHDDVPSPKRSRAAFTMDGLTAVRAHLCACVCGEGEGEKQGLGGESTQSNGIDPPVAM
jgi:hypothetical protein